MFQSCSVSEIFNVEKGRALEIWVGFGGHSRSLTAAPFIRSYATSYHSVIVDIVLSCTILEIFDVEEYCDLKTHLRGHSFCEFM